MASWLRLILSVLALVGLLASGTGGALAAKSHHHCPGMMMADCSTSGGDHAKMPDCCTAPACAIAQPAQATQSVVPAPSASSVAAASPRNDDQRLGLSTPPDLHPPIA